MEDLSTFTPENLIIPSKAFDEILNQFSNRLTGKTMKRFELSDSKEVIKSQVKEIIYEEARNLRDIIIALNFGIQAQTFIFKSKEKI